MTDFKLEAKLREEAANKTRAEGFIPGIVYGKGLDNTKISLEKTNFLRLYKEAGTSNLVELTINGSKGAKTLIHDIQLDPIKSEILHVDFYKVNMKEKIHAEVPLKFIGDSVAVIEKEGSLITSKDSIEVECLPADLIPELEVDISVLDDFEKSIKISDLKIPAGVEILDDPEEMIAHVEEPRSEEELAELEEEVVEDVSAIEVENKGEEAPAAEGEGEKTEEKSAE
ncbi:MAG: 50S ribosomal protein L25 [Patescibacteria group bacterium]|nr:50S ribosomal protein L25 [Patescibacteria group bacterium]